MRFSERYGYKKVRTKIQYELVDETTRKLLWNLMHIKITKPIYSGYTCDSLDNYAKSMWHLFFKETIDSIPQGYDYHLLIEHLKKFFFSCSWFEALDFLEAFPLYYDLAGENFRSVANEVLEQENSSYRFVNESIVEINNELEIETIESAFKLEPIYKSVRIHLETALNLLTDKNNTDYRNSVKESISAIESMCKIILNDEKATLGRALDKLEKTKNLHPALKESYKKLYGYTSDANGIRHAFIKTDSIVDYREAIYILINCSAFINYLKDIE